MRFLSLALALSFLLPVGAKAATTLQDATFVMQLLTEVDGFKLTPEDGERLRIAKEKLGQVVLPRLAALEAKGKFQAFVNSGRQMCPDAYAKAFTACQSASFKVCYEWRRDESTGCSITIEGTND